MLKRLTRLWSASDGGMALSGQKIRRRMSIYGRGGLQKSGGRSRGVLGERGKWKVVFQSRGLRCEGVQRCVS
jgi:hypothetical protein